MKQKIPTSDRIGLIKENKQGSLMTIVEYNSCTSVVVKFIKDGNLVHSSWNQFCLGSIKNPYDKTVYGVGYIGEGDYKAHIRNKTNPSYAKWRRMLMRCYNEKYLEKYPAYKDAIVCDNWHNFQNFAAWYDQNYYEIDGEIMNLDKDILIKGNKEYNPNNCIFVPTRINNLFVKTDAKRGMFPIGVNIDKNDSKYISKCSIGNRKSQHLGRYNSPEKAFAAYKKFKEKLIKQIAEEYKDKIPNKLYEALINYTVEITD